MATNNMSWPEFKCRGCGKVAETYKQWIACERICRKLKRSRERNNELEIDMANSVHDDSPVVNAEGDHPVVRLAILLMDDQFGITVEAYEILQEVAELHCPKSASEFDKILCQTKGSEGRVYLPEDWKENV